MTATSGEQNFGVKLLLVSRSVVKVDQRLRELLLQQVLQTKLVKHFPVGRIVILGKLGKKEV